MSRSDELSPIFRSEIDLTSGINEIDTYFILSQVLTFHNHVVEILCKTVTNQYNLSVQGFRVVGKQGLALLFSLVESANHISDAAMLFQCE